MLDVFSCMLQAVPTYDYILKLTNGNRLVYSILPRDGARIGNNCDGWENLHQNTVAP